MRRTQYGIGGGGITRDATGNPTKATHEVVPFSASTVAQGECVALMDW